MNAGAYLCVMGGTNEKWGQAHMHDSPALVQLLGVGGEVGST